MFISPYVCEIAHFIFFIKFSTLLTFKQKRMPTRPFPSKICNDSIHGDIIQYSALSTRDEVGHSQEASCAF